jgi:hypothetical protein
MFVPLMASRLMLSLKKAAAEPRGAWSVATMTTFGPGKPLGGGTLAFASQTLSESCESSAPPNEENMELEFVPGLFRNRGSRQQLS